SAIVGHSFGAFSTGFALANYSEFDGMPFVSIGSPNTLKSVLENFSQLAGLSALQSNYMSCKIEKKYGIKVEDFELAKFIQSHSGPTMVVHDQQDRQVDYSEVEQIQQQARSADYLITKGLGHNRILNDPQTIHSIINFINRWRDSRDNFEIAFKFGIV
ncbi:MAG: hypothetical protein HN623_05140, partial [Bdellovibrionales bacterium]|nr:hypothetical protein [Bdellovibrionales bacterium]